MKFLNPDKQLSMGDVVSAENELGLTFPEPLRRLFLENNGADPDPYVFESITLHTVVNETLPLFSEMGRGTAIDTYKMLVIEKAIVARNFFPFAVDAGGDYFFVNCDNPVGAVYFYRSDTAYSKTDQLQQIASSLDDFWDSLQSEKQ